MYDIKKAIIRIDLNEYAENLWRYPGQIDCSPVNREASETILVDSYDDLECAEANIDRTVYVMITDSDVILDYQFIAGEETVYIKDCSYKGVLYPCDDTFFSRECYEKIMQDLDTEDD